MIGQTFSVTFYNVDPAAFNILTGLNPDGSVPDGWHYEDIDPSSDEYAETYATQRLVKTTYQVWAWRKLPGGSWDRGVLPADDLTEALEYANELALAEVRQGYETNIKVTGSDRKVYRTIGAPSER